MIIISGDIVARDKIVNQYPPNSLERKIADQLASSKDVYKYDSLDQLNFDIKLRANIVRTAIELYESDVSFTTFRKSECNADYWNRTDAGGFLLREDVKPSNAIKDIFINSSQYGTECATAIVIIYYRALVNILPEEIFNKMFPVIYLLGWQYISKNLYIEAYDNITEFFIGDCQYFKNPDVSLITPELRGENVINLGNGAYFGHGMGIKSANGIIEVLNDNRRIGATESAFLTDFATRLNSNQIFDKSNSFTSIMEAERYREIHRTYKSNIYY